ncbi:transcription termination factor NusA [Ezakiella peruensis]|uniref:transcription termination factor NusA n=1 Tax=Ezakiella peruensis TaxID=1464038 RepID=UPI000C1B3DFC|nr:transcription termination factor NusA [Ezakiella peruensis]
MNREFIEALDEIEAERGVPKDVIIESICSALVSSYKKNYNTASNVEIDISISEEDGSVHVFNLKNVVEEVEDEATEISLENAQKYIANPSLGDVVKVEITPKDFGRIAAQTAKQVVIQKLKDAEREVIYNEYIDRENEIITGQINRIRANSCYVDLGRLEGVLPSVEQSMNETYTVGDKLKMLITEVKKTGKGAQIVLSRSHPNLVRKLFELEVPEISEGTVEIFHVAREAGSRSKIAIFSRDPDVDPLGACVGFQGTRVRNVVNELNGEKIDIIIWSNDMSVFIKNALAPATVTEVFIDEEEHSSVVFVPEDQLSLAIGKEGQNARLAAKLTNWKIDIKSDKYLDEYRKEYESMMANKSAEKENHEDDYDDIYDDYESDYEFTDTNYDDEEDADYSKMKNYYSNDYYDDEDEVTDYDLYKDELDKFEDVDDEDLDMDLDEEDLYDQD